MSSNLFQITKALTYQGIGAWLIGVPIALTMFPNEHEGVDDSNALQVLGEIILQTSVLGLATSYVFDFLDRSGLRGASPVRDIPFIVTLLGTQFHLLPKIRNFTLYLDQKWKSFVPTSSQPANSSTMLVRDNPATRGVPSYNPDVNDM